MAIKKPNSTYKIGAIQKDLQGNQLDNNTSFSLREITLETIDAAVWKEFNKKFLVANQYVDLISLDADIASMRYENPVKYDEIKGYLNLPYFTMWRSKTSPFTRTSPSNKSLIYAIPIQKAQGVVWEEYIMPPPIIQKLEYQFKFITTYRQYTNEMEENFTDYFKNKRGVIDVEGEKFEISPATQFELADLDVADREGGSGLSLYILTYKVNVFAYTRKLSDIQKRERPNSYTLTVKEGTNKITEFTGKKEPITKDTPTE